MVLGGCMVPGGAWSWGCMVLGGAWSGGCMVRGCMIWGVHGPGGAWSQGGGGCMVQGGCMVPVGCMVRGGCLVGTPPRRPLLRAVCILLECILVQIVLTVLGPLSYGHTQLLFYEACTVGKRAVRILLECFFS